MDFKEAEQTLKSITYKPGYKFTWQWKHDRLGITLQSDLRADASGKQKELTHLYASRSVALEDIVKAKTEMFLVREVRELVKIFEEHEATEWFKYKGTCVDDPHPELRNFNLCSASPEDTNKSLSYHYLTVGKLKCTLTRLVLLILFASTLNVTETF